MNNQKPCVHTADQAQQGKLQLTNSYYFDRVTRLTHYVQFVYKLCGLTEEEIAIVEGWA